MPSCAEAEGSGRAGRAVPAWQAARGAGGAEGSPEVELTVLVTKALEGVADLPNVLSGSQDRDVAGQVSTRRVARSRCRLNVAPPHFGRMHPGTSERPGPESCRLTADDDFVNLGLVEPLKNAIRASSQRVSTSAAGGASPPEPGQVHVTLYVQHDTAWWIIRDDGVGLTQAQLRKVEREGVGGARGVDGLRAGYLAPAGSPGHPGLPAGSGCRAGLRVAGDVREEGLSGASPTTGCCSSTTRSSEAMTT